MIKKDYNKDLSGLNTFRMKVSSRLYIEFDSIADLFELDFEDLLSPVKCIGGGSNLLFTGDFKGTILRSRINFIEKLDEVPSGITPAKGEVLVSVGSGVCFDELCAWAAGEGLWGIENLSGIPGEVGGATVGNIGAYGQEFGDVVRKVVAYDPTEEEFISFSREECHYGYRESVFKPGCKWENLIITHVVIALSEVPAPCLGYGHLEEAVGADLSIGNIRSTVLKVRGSKLPSVSEVGSAGSFFKNPVVEQAAYDKIKNEAAVPVPHYDLPDGKVKIPAAWLLEQCGWKGRRSGNAAVWESQPLVLVNATSLALPEEILSLESRIRVSVRSRFGIELQSEVEHI